MTKTQIVLGATGPMTGAESQYEPTLTGAKAYFDYVNAHGGVNGRKIVYKIEDDQYDPSKTVPLTQKLVEQDRSSRSSTPSAPSTRSPSATT